MPKKNKPPTDERKQRQIQDILDILYHEEDLTGTEAEEIRQWLAGSDNEELKYSALYNKFIETYRLDDHSQNAERLWPELSKRLGFTYDPFADKKEETPLPVRTKKMPLHRRWGFRVAAVLVPLLVIGGAVGLLVYQTGDSTGRTAENLVTVSAAAHDPAAVELPDGSVIKPTGGSTISYSENFAEDRTVYLSGEGYFKVVKQSGQTFIVKTDNITVTVLGTEFNLKDYADEQTAEVTLTTGSVALTAEGIEETKMTPGQHIVYNKEHQIIELDEIGEGELLRLRGINLSFSGQTLDEAFAMMSQYFRVKVMVSERLDLHERIDLPTEDDATLEDVLMLLQLISNEDFEYTIQADTVRVTPKR